MTYAGGASDSRRRASRGSGDYDAETELEGKVQRFHLQTDAIRAARRFDRTKKARGGNSERSDQRRAVLSLLNDDGVARSSRSGKAQRDVAMSIPKHSCFHGVGVCGLSGALSLTPAETGARPGDLIWDTSKRLRAKPGDRQKADFAAPPR